MTTMTTRTMMTLAYRARFGLKHDPMPRDASGKTCFSNSDDAAAVALHFDWLAAEPGVGLLTGHAGLGKTTLLRHLCDALPAPEHKIVYICDTAATPAAVYRNLAAALGLDPKLRRDALWRQLKYEVRNLIDKQFIVPILILDEAQHLGDDFLVDFSGFLNYAFDRQTLLTVWLCGLPSLRARLDLQHHKPLRQRIIAPKTLRPKTRDELLAMVAHGMKAAGGDPKVFADPALEVLYRASRGIPRTAAHLLRVSLACAHLRDRDFIDEDTMLAACNELELITPQQDQRQGARANHANSRG